MNEGPNQPQQHQQHQRNRKPRRRRRNFGAQNQGQNQGQGQGQNQQGPSHGRQGGGGQNRKDRGRSRGPRRSNAFVGPMDHSYRNQNGAGNQASRFTNGAQPNESLDPVVQRHDAPTRIFAFIDDLFFVAKINEISRKLNVKVEFVKSEKDIADKGAENPSERPSLIIVDLNSNGIKPLPIITKLRSKFKKSTSIVGFVSHVQGDLKLKAQEAGCDVVMPRSAFSQNLISLLRRHGAEEEIEDTFNRA